jgi:hypothetical protein
MLGPSQRTVLLLSALSTLGSTAGELPGTRTAMAAPMLVSSLPTFRLAVALS